MRLYWPFADHTHSGNLLLRRSHQGCTAPGRYLTLRVSLALCAVQAVEWEDGEEGTTGAQHMASRCNPSESAEVPLAPYMALLGGDCSRGLTNPMPFPLSLLPALGAHTQPHHEDPTGSGPSAQQASKRRRHTTTSIPDPSVFYNPLGHSGRLASGSCSASQPFVGVGAMGVPLHRRISDPLESGQQLGLAATQGMQQEAAAPLSCLDACSKPADVVAPPYQSLTSPADGQYTGQAMADPRRSGFVEPAHIMEEAATAAGSGLELLTSAVATIVSPEKRDHSCASAAPAPTAASSNSSNNGLAGPHSGPPPHAPGPLQQEAIANYLLAQAQLHAHQMLAYKLAMAAVAQQLTAAAPASDIGDVSPLLAEAGAHNPKSHDLTRGAWHAAHSDAHGRLVATDGYEREDKRARATAYV